MKPRLPLFMLLLFVALAFLTPAKAQLSTVNRYLPYDTPPSLTQQDSALVLITPPYYDADEKKKLVHTFILQRGHLTEKIGNEGEMLHIPLLDTVLTVSTPDNYIKHLIYTSRDGVLYVFTSIGGKHFRFRKLFTDTEPDYKVDSVQHTLTATPRRAYLNIR